jgi:hypothetical protein
MASELASAVHKATVGSAQLRQHELFSLDAGRTLVLCSAVGPPRLWGYGLDAAVQGFVEGCERPHDGKPSTRLSLGLDGARRGLRSRIDMLIERRSLDVAVLALSMHAAQLEVLCVGPSRAYLRRAGSIRRLTPKEDLATGLLAGGEAFCSEELREGDLLVGGSRGAFIDESLAALANLLASEPHTSAQSLTDVLNAPAVRNGVAVASFALRL